MSCPPSAVLILRTPIFLGNLGINASVWFVDVRPRLTHNVGTNRGTKMGQLTAISAKNAKPGRHSDGKGLYLLVKPSGAKSWLLRINEWTA